ncbi:hypothetical protein ACIGKR_17725 [Rhodococcus qingshengii]|uniref:hypothetical protein n=1 Tax=Rhodococcus qingshengii TaxID=334542 RepID=UPI0037C66BC9
MSEYTVSVIAVVISLIAVAIAGAAAWHAKRLADTEAQAAREREFGWKIERTEDEFFCCKLTNTGTVDAEDVKLAGAYEPLGFKVGIAGADNPVTIGAGQSRRFAAHTDIHDHKGGDITIRWNPVAGSRVGERQSWTEAAPAGLSLY